MDTNRGLILDGFTIDSPDKKSNETMNIILTPDKLSIQNEPGFTKQFEIQGELIGNIETPNSIIDFYKTIEYNNPVLNIYRDNRLIAKSKDIPCSVTNPISGTYTYNYKNELIIVWCSGVNNDSDEIRYLNCDNPQCELDDQDLSIVEVDKTLLNSNLPTVEYTPINDMAGGMLKAGTYFIALSMNINNFDKTSYSQLSDPIYLINKYMAKGIGYMPDAITNNAIRVTATIDTNIYASCNIAILYFNGITTSVKILEKILIKNVMGINKIDTYINDLNSLLDGNINEILIKQNPYIKTNVLTSIQNKLILGGNKLISSVNHITQLAANKIYFECVPIAYQSTEYYSQSEQDKLLQQTFQEDEVYAFYAGYRYKKGGYISIVHIPGPDGSNYKTSNLHPLESKNANELYEDDFPDLANTPVRHHRMPSYKNIVRYLNKAVYYTETINITSIIGNPAGANPILFNTNSYDWTKRKYNTTIIDGTTIGVFNGHRIICSNYTDKSLIVEGTITIIIPGITDDIGFFLKRYNNEDVTISPVDVATNINIEDDNELIDTNYFIPVSTEIIQGVGKKYTFNINYKKTINQSIVYTLGMEYPNIVSITGNLKIGVQEQTAENIKKFTIQLRPKEIAIPTEIQSICNGVDIFCAKRTMYNSRIIDQDVIHTRFINHCVAYGVTTDSELFNENKTDLYFKGHAYSLLHQYPNISFVKNIDIYGFENVLGDDTTGLYNGGQTEVELRNIIDPYTINLADPLRYVKNNNASDNNIRGEGAIRIKPSSDLRNILPEQYKDTPERHTNMYTQRVFYFINYLTNNTNFYTNYRNQEIIKLGSVANNSLIKGDIFYTFNYGIRTSRLETDLATLPSSDTDETRVFRHLLIYSIKSHYNLASRFRGLDKTQIIYPYNFQTSDICNIPTIYDNYIKRDTDDGFNIAYNKRCDYYTYINSHRDDDTEINKNIIPVSNVQSTESKEFRWRYFDPTSYKSIPFNKGFIINILSNGTILYIQTLYSLYLAKLKDVLNMTDGQQAYLGSGDVFDRDPEEIISDKDGYIGCQHKYATTINENGYFVVDAMKRKIFWITGQQNIAISSLDATNFFDKELGITTTDNPYLITEGIELISDQRNERVIYKNNKTNTNLSFSIKGSTWMSKHEYNTFKTVNNRTGLKHYINDIRTINTIPTKFAIKANHEFNSNFGKYGNYIINPITDNIKKSYVDFIFTSEDLTNTLLQTIIWKSEVKDTTYNLYDDTISFIMVYNKTQCSGIIPLRKSNAFYFTDGALLKNDTWFFNKFEDNVLNDKLLFLDNNKQPTTNVNKLRKPWYKQSQFISDIHVVRFGLSNNTTDNCIVLHMADIISLKDSR